MSDNQTSPELTGMNVHLLVTCVIAADVIAIFNNVILLVIIVVSTRLRDITSVFIGNQALADINIAIIMLCYSTVDESRYHKRDIFLALGWMRLSMFVFYSVSLQMLGAVSLNLCVAICYAHYYTKLMTRVRVYVLIVLLWIMNIGIGLLDLQSETFWTSKALPHMFLADQKWSEWWIVGLNLTTLLLLPMTIAIISFIRIFWHTHNITDVGSLSTRTTRHIRQAMSVLVIGIVYMMTFLPVIVTQIVLKSRTAHSLADSIIALTAVLVNYSYLVIKLPLFLGLFRSYRDFVKRVLCCSKRRVHNVNEGIANTSQQHMSATDVNEQSNSTDPNDSQTEEKMTGSCAQVEADSPKYQFARENVGEENISTVDHIQETRSEVNVVTTHERNTLREDHEYTKQETD